MSQTNKLKDLLLDTEPHNTLEIRQVVYGNGHLNMARIAARIIDLKKQGYTIRGWKENGQYWYQMMPAKTYELERGGQTESRWSHNPQIAGSTPAPATKKAYQEAEEQIMARMLR